MSGLRYRPGCVADVPNALQLLQAERVPLGPRLWSGLPELLPELLKREMVKAYVIEEGDAGRLRWFGLSAFLTPEVLRLGLLEMETPFRRFLLQAALDNAQPFLSQRQIASSNAASDLNLTVLLCQPDVGEYTQEQGGLLFRMAYDSFCFAHAGFGLASFWQEVADHKRAEVLEGLGLVLHRRMVTEKGPDHFLLNYTRERAQANPGQAMSFVFNGLAPRFGFSTAQQQLLESALLDVSDRDFAIAHRVTDDAVKKRWRAVYDRVSAVEPSMATAEQGGANQRRVLLGYLRQHLEELRPYHQDNHHGQAPRSIPSTNSDQISLSPFNPNQIRLQN